MSRANLDLKLAALAAVEGLVVATAVDQTAARVVPAILLALVAPGYALSVALLPQARDGYERLLLALGLSVTRSHCRDDLLAFIEKQGIPFVTTLHAKGFLPESHPNWGGVLGRARRSDVEASRQGGPHPGGGLRSY